MKILSLFVCLSFFGSSYAQAGALPVPLQHQEQSNWCWAGTSQGILGYFGNNVAQCTIANWALSRTDCCNTPVIPAGCNIPLSMYGTAGNDSIQSVLQNFGTITTIGQNSVLTPANMVTEMNAGRPFMIRWQWLPNTTGAAHFLTVKGFIGNNSNGIVHLNNPWDGEVMTDYNNVVSDTNSSNNTANHNWTHTLSVTGRTTPSTNISVNGSEGPTLSVNASTMLNVNIESRPNGNNTNADWWVGYVQNGILYYITPTNSVTTVPTPWRQGSLTALNQSVFNGRLAPGTYDMYFAVDLTQNGVLDANAYWDMITVQVN